MTWLYSDAVRLLTLPCGHTRYILWGTYGRNPRPAKVEIRIQRLYCKICACTHAVIPAFLLGRVHYTLATVGPYFDRLAAEPISIATAWKTDTAAGFPLDLSTLYRWFKRLAIRLLLLLSLLEKELLELAPQTSLASLEKLLLTRAACHSRPTGSVLTLHALCQTTFTLAKHLLRINNQLLRIPRHQKLEPLGFLNFFAWQKIGQALLSPLPEPSVPKDTPLPQKSHPPPPALAPPTHLAHG
ncbi:MAG: hypothetical protein ACREBU_05660 [Nitrososphaera sp.]